MSVVLDASMTIAWFFADERTDGTDRTLLRVAEEGALVPAHWRLEVANSLRNAVRHGRCGEDYADSSIKRLGRLAIEADSETDAHAWGATRKLARDLDLTIYDAAYLELALRAGQPLASCDEALIRAAQRRRVEVLAA
jgi:predicted nucleic acid-binding protein